MTNQMTYQRKTYWVLAAFIAMFVCGHAFSIGLGEVQLRSGLGHRLDARVPILGAAPDSIATSCVSAQVNHIDGEPLLTPRIEILDNAKQQPFIHLTTATSIVEPAVTLTVSLTCEANTQKTYSLLLDYIPHDESVAKVSAYYEEKRQDTWSQEGNPEDAAFMGVEHSFAAPPLTPTPVKRKKKVEKSGKANLQPIQSKQSVPVETAPRDELKMSNQTVVAPVGVSSEKTSATPEENMPSPVEGTLATQPHNTLKEETAHITEEASGVAAANKKIKLLETEILQLKVQLQRTNNQQQTVPLSLIIINGVMLLSIVALLFGFGKLWLSTKRSAASHSFNWGDIFGKASSPTRDGALSFAQNSRIDEPTIPPNLEEASHLYSVDHTEKTANQTEAALCVDNTVPDSEPIQPIPFGLQSLTNLKHDKNTSVQLEELSDFTQEAEFWMSLNNPKRAIEILEPYSYEGNLTTPVTLLYLLDLYRLVQDEEKYEALRTRMGKMFNAHIPAFNDPVDKIASKSLEDYEHIIQHCCALWQTEDMLPYLESLVVDDREGNRAGFDLSVYRDILFLLGICKELERAKNKSV